MKKLAVFLVLVMMVVAVTGCGSDKPVLKVYNAGEYIEASVRSILSQSFKDIELIVINDGSKDNTLEVMQQLAQKDEKVKYLSFSRNFGKEAAMFAGLEASKGDCVLVMDCDLQHPPEVIPEMYQKWQAGAEIVEGRKSSRGKESAAYGLFAKLFNGIIKSTSGIDMLDSSDFKLLDRKAASAILNMPERVTFFRAMSAWVGFKTETVMFDVRDREFGERKWSTKSLIRYAISSLASYTNLPLVLPLYVGILVCLLSAAFGVLDLCGVHILSVGVCLICLLCGVILCFMGVFGYYLYRIFDEVRLRPRYIVSHTCGGKND